jgi:hypothetical protein
MVSSVRLVVSIKPGERVLRQGRGLEMAGVDRGLVGVAGAARVTLLLQQ